MGFSSNIYLLLSAMGFGGGLDDRGTMLFYLYFICAPMALIVGDNYCCNCLLYGCSKG